MSKITGKLSYVLFVLLMAASAHGIELAEIGDRKVNVILAPTLGAPEIVEAGSGFQIVLQPRDAHDLTRAWLTPENQAAPETPLQIGHCDASGTGLLCLITIPEDAASGLYDLHIVENGLQDTQPHSVAVVDEFKKDFSFAVVSDIHFGDTRGRMFAPDEDFDVLRRNVLAAASARNPEFILLTGDVVNEPGTYRRDYEQAWDYIVTYCRAPVFMVPGNHDGYGKKNMDGKYLDGKEYWRAFFGATHHVFDYGGMRFVGIDNYDWPEIFRFNLRMLTSSESINRGNMSEEQFDWLRQNLDGAGSRNVVAYAHLPLDQMKGGMPFEGRALPGVPAADIIGLLASHNVSHIFVGHWHRNETREIQGMQQVMTNTSGSVLDSDVRWGYNMVYVKDSRIDRFEFTEVGFEQ